MKMMNTNIESDYEAKRKRRMLENQAKLKELGIKTGIFQKQKVMTQRPLKIKPPEAPLRRSNRHLNKPNVHYVPIKGTAKEHDKISVRKLQAIKREEIARNYMEKMQNAADFAKTQGKKSIGSKNSSVIVYSEDKVVYAVPVIPAPSSIAYGTRSSSTLRVNLGTFHWQWLGKRIFPIGKKTIMDAVVDPTEVYKPSYSIISGVQLWYNACMLFVNVNDISGEPSTTIYDNTFTRTKTGDVYMKWFAPKQQHADSKMIQRLIYTVQGDDQYFIPGANRAIAQVPGHKHNVVVLFIRHGAQYPYIYCGKLGLLGYYPDPSPMEFRWQLLDIGKGLNWEDLGLTDSNIKLDD